MFWQYVNYSRERLQDLACYFVGPKCSKVIFEDLNFFDMSCNRLVLSKFLSLGILLGGLFVKVPQILKVLMSGSSRGLSLLSLFIETTALLISVAYNLRKQHPFTTFGESLFIMIQNAILVALVLSLRYSKSESKRTPGPFGAFLVFTWIGTFVTSTYGMIRFPSTETLSLLQGWTIGLVIASRVPQILLNFINQSTGELSFLTTSLMAAGSVARVFTTWQEVPDAQLLWSVCIAASLNIILLGQLLWYWRSRSNLYDSTKKND